MAKLCLTYSERIEIAEELMSEQSNEALIRTANINDFNSIEATAARYILKLRGINLELKLV